MRNKQKPDPMAFRYRSDSIYIGDARNVECVCVPREDEPDLSASIVFKSGATVVVSREEAEWVLRTLVDAGWKNILPIAEGELA